MRFIGPSKSAIVYAKEEIILSEKFLLYSVERATHICNSAKTGLTSSVNALIAHIVLLHSYYCNISCDALNMCVHVLYTFYIRLNIRIETFYRKQLTEESKLILDNYVKHRLICKRGALATALFFRPILCRDMAVYIAKMVWEFLNKLYE